MVIENMLQEMENLRLRVALKQAWPFIEHLKHRERCQGRYPYPCLNCRADKFDQEFPWVKELK